MNSAKRYLALALSFAICMAVFAAFAPRIAHAVTATLVQVVNPSTSPVQAALTDAQNAFVVTRSCNFGDSPYFRTDLCPIEDTPLYTVPANKIAVIESTSGRCITDQGTSAVQFRLVFTAPDGSEGQRVLAMQTPAQTDAGASVNHVPLNITVAVSDQRTYAAGGAAGAPVLLDVFASEDQTPINGAPAPNNVPNCVISLSGHLAPAQ
jgi:hypothetical protein